VILFALLFACKEKTKPTKAAAPFLEDEPSEAEPLVHSAHRCGECHASIEKEWAASAHSRAAKSSLYKKMLAQTEAKACEPCHEPFVGHAGVTEPALSEGVSCEVCHTMPEVTVSKERGTFELHPEENTKYGPLCDAKAPYFHKVSCTTLHAESRFCAACHLLIQTTPQGVTLPIFTEYEEWLQSPYAKNGTPCQECHMPGAKGVVAEGADVREDVPHHGFLSRDGLLRQYALSGQARLFVEGKNLVVEISLTNEGAGHSVPSGLPGRQVVLRVSAIGDSGVLATQEKSYQKTLVNAQGEEAPFYQAAKLLEDNRIAPEELRKERFTFTEKATEIEVELLWRELSPALIKAIGANAPREQRLLYSRIPWKGGAAPIELALQNP
jgi:hypothetical protein